MVCSVLEGDGTETHFDELGEFSPASRVFGKIGFLNPASGSRVSSDSFLRKHTLCLVWIEAAALFFITAALLFWVCPDFFPDI